VIAGTAVRTPLVRLQVDAPAEIWLKLENLQPIGSFKIRGAYNAIRQADPEELAGGVLTASAGNMAQGLAWSAREVGVPATIVAPDHIPDTKRAAIERLGGRLVTVPVDDWFQAIQESRFPGVDGFFIHPAYDHRVIAGNGTIALELLEDLPEPDAVLIPWGGGGLTVGIGSAVKALRPATKIYTVEPETAAPLAASMAAGEPREVDYRPSFVDGAGARVLDPGMWALAEPIVDGALTVSLDETAAAVRLLA
jgi:threonine dehydratase